MTYQHQEFLNRLGRVARAPQNGVSMIGPAQSQNVGRNHRLTQMLQRHKSQGVHGRPMGEPRLKVTQIISYVIAFGMGGMAAVIARALRYQISGQISGTVTPNADFDLALDVIFAIVIAFVLREAVSLSAVKRMGAQCAGILLAMATMHNVVHHMPDMFARLFSTQWVEHVMQTTEPGTLNFRGQSYKI